MVAGRAVTMGLGDYVVVAVPHVPRRPGRVSPVLVAEGLALRVGAVDVEVAEVAIEGLSVRRRCCFLPSLAPANRMILPSLECAGWARRQGGEDGDRGNRLSGDHPPGAAEPLRW
jgi:hypothetical protein